MAGRSATLTVRIVSDASKAAAGFSDAETRVERFERGLDRASVAAAGVLAGVGLMAKEAFDAASALEQSSGAVESVFAGQAAAITELARGAAQAVGLSQNSYQELASVLGAQLSNMGYAGSELTAQTDALIRTGADLAATFGGTTADAVSALSSLMRGERDPIERYGIALNQAAVDAQVAAMGLDTSTPAAKRAADAQATLAIVAEQSAAAQGAFARESDTAAGATQRASAQFENAKAALGEVLLPIVADAAAKFAEFTGFLVEHQTATLVVVGVVAALAAGILVANAAFSIYRGILVASAVAQWALNSALLANPITWIVIAVMALVAAFVLAYQKSETFRNIVDAVGRALLGAFNGARSAVQWIIDKVQWVLDKAGAVGSFLGSLNPFSAPAAPAVVGAPGLFGAAAMRGAPLGSGAGGGGVGPTSTGSGPAPMVVNVTVNGALDPVAVGRQIESLLRDYGRATGRRVSLAVN